MAWIESHTVLARHRKCLELAFDLKVKPVQVVGHLHVFWHTVLEQQEDGDLTKWSDQLIAQAAMWEGDATEFVARLRERGWLDGSLVHDWIDYVGPFLTRKYSSGNPERLKEIWASHGYKYGKGQGKYTKKKATPKRVNSEQEARLPNLTLPNPSLPNQTKPNQTIRMCERRQTLEEFELTQELAAWAMQEFKVIVPDDVFREFKSYWRDQPDKKLRSDWDATYKNRVRELVTRGTLRPQPTAQVPPPQAKCAWANTPCECYAAPGSKYCPEHRDKLKAIQSKVAGKPPGGEVVSIQTGALLSAIGRSM